jgi:hypothetical protein
LRRRRREVDEQKKRDYITKYLDTIGEALQEILAFSDAERARTTDSLKVVLEQSRTMAVNDSERAKKRREPTEAVVDEPASSVPSTTSPGPSAAATQPRADARARRESKVVSSATSSTLKRAAKAAAPKPAPQAPIPVAAKTRANSSSSTKAGPAPSAKKARR